VTDERLPMLALWHARRRELDELLSPLLVYGPLAVEKVAEHLDELRLAQEAESAAYRAFLVAQDLAVARSDGTAPTELAALTEQLKAARQCARAYVHPLVGRALEGHAVVLPLRSPARS
jgi:hypothetical protein